MDLARAARLRHGVRASTAEGRHLLWPPTILMMAPSTCSPARCETHHGYTYHGYTYYERLRHVVRPLAVGPHALVEVGHERPAQERLHRRLPVQVGCVPTIRKCMVLLLRTT